MNTSRDWDDAYSNGAYIADAAGYPARWAAQAAQWRSTANAELDIAYGPGAREQLDIFWPDVSPQGLLVFIHGGYWLAFDKSSWSHLAAGALARGWAVALPSYPLAPAAHISEMTRCMGRAVEQAAARVAGPIALAGHSAGGHLAARMVCSDSPLSTALRERVQRLTSISGLHDLRPLRYTRMNATWGMTLEEARLESPALHEPWEQIKACCWVGAQERPEFLRQSALLALLWGGMGLEIEQQQAAGRHHFNVIDDLMVADSALLKACLG